MRLLAVNGLGLLVVVGLDFLFLINTVDGHCRLPCVCCRRPGVLIVVHRHLLLWDGSCGCLLVLLCDSVPVFCYVLSCLTQSVL